MRRQSNTRLPIAALSPDPAKRCETPQSFNASDAGRLRASISARISIAALARADGSISSR